MNNRESTEQDTKELRDDADFADLGRPLESQYKDGNEVESAGETPPDGELHEGMTGRELHNYIRSIPPEALKEACMRYAVNGSMHSELLEITLAAVLIKLKGEQ